jgi:DnaJ family protein C protein 7
VAVDLDRQAAYLNNRAAAHMMLHGYAEAQADALAAARLDPAQGKYLLRAGKCALALGAVAEAERLADQAAAADATCAPAAAQDKAAAASYTALLRAAGDAVAGGQHNHAQSLLDRADALAPAAPAVRHLRAEAFLGQGKHGEVERLASGLLRADPHDPRALALRARMFYLQGELERAVDHYARALRADPDHGPSRTGLKRARALLAAKEAGNAAYKGGDDEAALRHYAEALAVEPDAAAAAATAAKIHFNRAAVLQRLGRCPEALAACDAALACDEGYTKALCRRARIHLELEHYDEAICDFEAAAEREPECGQCLFVCVVCVALLLRRPTNQPYLGTGKLSAS